MLNWRWVNCFNLCKDRTVLTKVGWPRSGMLQFGWLDGNLYEFEVLNIMDTSRLDGRAFLKAALELTGTLGIDMSSTKDQGYLGSTLGRTLEIPLEVCSICWSCVNVGKEFQTHSFCQLYWWSDLFYRLGKRETAPGTSSKSLITFELWDSVQRCTWAC